MLALLLTSILALPVWPLNPTQNDTLETVNLQFSAGLAGPNSVGSAGPLLTFKHEWLVLHPLVLRSSLDYRSSNVDNKVQPKGMIHQGTLSLESFYYKSNQDWTAYIGIGILYALNSFHPAASTSDSLKQFEGVDDISMKDSFGARLGLGLRYRRAWALEVSVTETNSKFLYRASLGDNTFQTFDKKLHLADIRVTVGYLWHLR
jgi:hypothetical protein